jgi:predicted RNA-binding Zn-ribbon protein involved in translation (DUF1610 family)
MAYCLYTLLANRKIMDEEIQCNNCGWTGDSTMLVSKTDALDDRDFNYCPDCGSDDIEDIEDE